ncbi:MAG TPA: tetratricopeptide repeat protein, partial [Flavisolibacter sp.]|nr:tetratricopeptide repeat protein [Flavisolibacter sp.]
MKSLKPYLTILTLFVVSSVFAQYDASRINKKAIESYNRGLEHAQDGNFKEALKWLQESVQKDPNYLEAYLSLAGVYGQMKNREQSVEFYEKAFRIDSNYTSDYRLPYAINLAGLGRFDQALNTIQALLSKANLSANTRKAAEYRKKTFQFALDFERTNRSRKYIFKPVNMGEEINSAESEYFPSIPVESDKLVFTRKLNRMNEDFYGSIKKDG